MKVKLKKTGEIMNIAEYDTIILDIRVECLNRKPNKPTCSKVAFLNKIKYVHELQNLLTFAGLYFEFKI